MKHRFIVPNACSHRRTDNHDSARTGPQRSEPSPAVDRTTAGGPHLRHGQGQLQLCQ